MPTPDFIRLNGEAVRLTSLTRGPATDEMTAVVMLRGLRDHERLIDLLGRSPVSVALPGEDARAMSIARNEFTSSGAGASALYRHVITLREGAAEATEPETMELRLARIEEKLDRVLELLQQT